MPGRPEASSATAMRGFRRAPASCRRPRCLRRRRDRAPASAKLSRCRRQRFATPPAGRRARRAAARNACPSRRTSAGDTGPRPGSAPCDLRSPSASPRPRLAAPQRGLPAPAQPATREASPALSSDPPRGAPALRARPATRSGTCPSPWRTCRACSVSPTASPRPRARARATPAPPLPRRAGRLHSPRPNPRPTSRGPQARRRGAAPRQPRSTIPRAAAAPPATAPEGCSPAPPNVTSRPPIALWRSLRAPRGCGCSAPARAFGAPRPPASAQARRRAPRSPPGYGRAPSASR
mmetsp:Transcript_42783/g.124376  ORF Transcript_42783/g.124376 Transcript_42783/m.124376 type:complete len:293 (+) Transcript_42783:175-1053(+)